MTDQDQLKAYAETGIADILALFGIPANTAIQLYQDVLSRRTQEGMDILNEVLSEVRQGNFNNLNKHEIVSVCARYQRDAMEGVARNNLYLLARTIKGMAEGGSLEAPSFNKYANILATLTEEEVKVLGIMAQDRPESEIQQQLAEIPNHESIQQALLRTGLLFMIIIDSSAQLADPQEREQHPTINSTVEYKLTSLMHEVLQYTDFIIENELSE